MSPYIKFTLPWKIKKNAIDRPIVVMPSLSQKDLDMQSSALVYAGFHATWVLNDEIWSKFQKQADLTVSCLRLDSRGARATFAPIWIRLCLSVQNLTALTSSAHVTPNTLYPNWFYALAICIQYCILINLQKHFLSFPLYTQDLLCPKKFQANCHALFIVMLCTSLKII